MRMVPMSMRSSFQPRKKLHCVQYPTNAGTSVWRDLNGEENELYQGLEHAIERQEDNRADLH